VREVLDHAVEQTLGAGALDSLSSLWTEVSAAASAVVEQQGIDPCAVEVIRRLALRYAGSDTAFHVSSGSVNELIGRFEEVHRARFGFVSPEKDIIIESMQVEAVGAAARVDITSPVPAANGEPLGVFPTFVGGAWQPTPFLARERMAAGILISGPAVIVESTATTVVDPGWSAIITPAGDLVLDRVEAPVHEASVGTNVDPVQLEIFNNLFMNIAEQMGLVLENTAASVNIKERLDFSCAVFDPAGDLIANAPHMPVHLGSMDESIKSIIHDNPVMSPGDVYVMNAPYNGGTHLPDITVIKPVVDDTEDHIVFYVASRGHHADVGGSVPGSAPAGSTTVDEEGVLIDNFLLVRAGRFLEADLRELLGSGPWPARNPDDNVADLKAQVAACEKGTIELLRVIDHYGLNVVHAYMGHVKDNAE